MWIEPSDESVLIFPIYIDEEGVEHTILTLSDGWDPPRYKILGGRLNSGEHPIVGAKREFFEESGLVVTDLLQIKTILKDSWKGVSKKHTQYIFTGTVTSIENMLLRVQDGNQFLTNRVFTLQGVYDSVRHGVSLDGNLLLKSHSKILEKFWR